MFRLIFRQRRRILFGAFMFALAIVLYLPGLFSAGAWLFGGLTVMIVALLYCLCAILWILLFPDWRTLVEQLAVFVFVYAVFEAIWPEYYFVPVIGSFIPIAVNFALLMVIYGTTLDRFPLRLGIHQTRHFMSSKSPEILWEDLVPHPELIDTHWDNLLVDVVPLEDDEDTQIATYHHGASIFQKQRQTRLEEQFPTRAKYRYEGIVSEKSAAITSGMFTIELSPQADGQTRVSLTHTHDALLPRNALLMWFDDVLGDETDHHRASERDKHDWSMTHRYRRKVQALS